MSPFKYLTLYIDADGKSARVPVQIIQYDKSCIYNIMIEVTLSLAKEPNSERWRPTRVRGNCWRRYIGLGRNLIQEVQILIAMFNSVNIYELRRLVCSVDSQSDYRGNPPVIKKTNQQE
jgi:hypothetical protein